MRLLILEYNASLLQAHNQCPFAQGFAFSPTYHYTSAMAYSKSYQIDFKIQDAGESFHDENSGNHAVYDVLQEYPVQGTLNQAQK